MTMMLKQILIVVGLALCALLGAANLIAAAIWGVVFMRASGWVYWNDQPVLFCYAAVMSAVVMLALGGFAFLLVRSLIDEKQGFDRKFSAPKLEEPSHRFHQS